MATAVLQLTLYHPVGLKHFFLSVFAPGMLLNVLSSLPAPASILGEAWSSSSDVRKIIIIIILLYSVKSVNYAINCSRVL